MYTAKSSDDGHKFTICMYRWLYNEVGFCYTDVTKLFYK
jgi:hypothetical protein